MSSSNPSLGWERLHDVFYRSRECFTMQWDQEVDHFNTNDNLIAISNYCALIAIFTKFSNTLSLYSGSGILIMEIGIKTAEHVTAIGFNNKFEIIVIFKNGSFRKYYNFDGDFDEFNLVVDDHVIETKFWNDGFVVRLSNNKFKCVLGYDKPEPLDLASLFQSTELKRDIAGWNFIPPTNNTEFCVYISTVQNSIIKLSLSELIELKPPSIDSFTLISFTPNNDFVALYSPISKSVSILTADFRHVLNSVTFDNGKYPLELEWCSNDAVVISYADELNVIGPTDDVLNFFTDSKTFLKAEIDGLFMISNEKSEFLSRVSLVTSDTFRIGSTSPSAILLDAIDLIDNHSPKSMENLDLIKDRLIEAVDNCIRASTEEFEPFWQKKLLRAASFGKTMIELYNSEEFIEACNNLKILNIIRQTDVGIFLTHTQYLQLGADNLILNYLLKLKLHYLSLKICEFLNLSVYDQIIVDWSCSKIRSSINLTDDDILKQIISKLKVKTISFDQISRVAYQEGRLNLSIKLLSYEPDTAKKIPLLLEMEQDDIALMKSDEDLDMDSILYVLVILYNKLPIQEFFKLLDGKPNAIGIFKNVFAKQDKKLLNDYFYQDDSIVDMANIQLSQYLDAPTVELKKQHLNKAAVLLARSKFTEFEAKRLKEEVKEIDNKQKLLPDLDVNKPSLYFLEQLIAKDLTQAARYQKTFKISDKQFYYKVIRILAKDPSKHEQLYQFATSKKSPIGYQPFYIEYVKLKDYKNAASYIDLFATNYKLKVKLFLQCNDTKRAIEEANKKKDVVLLEKIKDITTNTVHIRSINDNLERLTGIRR
ncbi:unnamed protein product [Ambrosiozyma monospora]|uniref:Probable vacuolar protein sorting-associated protein 16 homolog n=1 Tax=Ambrosiozyma monospora TaxID=43982 RepID=A0A9W7DBC7_AMBMO|nr:unnamed protein product [Ambrosiozyma monospora]